MTFEEDRRAVRGAPTRLGIRVVERDDTHPSLSEGVGDSDDAPMILIGPGAVGEEERVASRASNDGGDRAARGEFHDHVSRLPGA